MSATGRPTLVTALLAGCGSLSGCVTYYDLDLSQASLAEHRVESGTNEEVCTARGRRFNLQYAHEAKAPPPAQPAPDGYRTYRFGPGEPGSVTTAPPWLAMSLGFMGAGVAAVSPPVLICLADCNSWQPWMTALSIAGGTLFAAGLSFLIVGLVDEKAGTYTREYEIIDMGQGALCED
ncbi:MAG: hypothetical protein JNK04_24340 [Myxococcales bacterium]|nr:hypothetical protein [Myxococcales bacterium]